MQQSSRTRCRPIRDPAHVLVIADRPVTLAVIRALLADAGLPHVVTRTIAHETDSPHDARDVDVLVLDTSGPDDERERAIAVLRRHLDADQPPLVVALVDEAGPRAPSWLAGARGSQTLPWPKGKSELGGRLARMLGLHDPIESIEPSAPVAGMALIGVDHSGRVSAWDEAAEAMFGVSEAEVIGRASLEDAIPGLGLEAGRDAAGVQGLMAVRRDGQRFAVDVSLLRATSGGDGAFTAMVRNASAVRAAQAEDVQDSTDRGGLERPLRSHALYDPLTGLPNEALFHARVERALASRGSEDRIAVALIDVALPWSTAGAAVPARIAGVIRDVVRASDTPAYLGGNRFGLLLEDLCSPAAAPAVAHRVLEEISRPVPAQVAGEGALDARIGLAFGDRVRSHDELLWRAEHALSKAGAEGHPPLAIFQSPFEGSRSQRTALGEDLRAALENGSGSLDAGAFRVLFQPQIEIATRRVTGVEALVRWSHAVHGEVPPNVFIPIAEDAGLIARLDELVLERALAEARSRGFPAVPVAVNVSGVELQDAGYARRLLDRLRATGTSPFLLELEITERVGIVQSSTAVANVARLRAAGVGVAIDDFGTGSAALSTLRAVAANRIKIDREFIADISAGDGRVVAAFVAMARGLGMGAIAEGVETAEQCAFLVGQGCLLAQGFLFSAPLTGRELVEFAAKAGTVLVGHPDPPPASAAGFYG